jgi:hypothetical protein
VSNPCAEHAADLVARLLGPAGEELTCEGCFEQLDRYVELELSGRGADVAVPRMRSHLEGCSACREDRDSLAALLGSEFKRPHGVAGRPSACSARSRIDESRSQATNNGPAPHA